MKYIILILIGSVLTSCDSKKTFSITLDSKNAQIDTIYVIESTTQKILATVPANGTHSVDDIWELDYSTTGSIQTKDGKQSYLTIILQDKELNIVIESDSLISTKDLGDSLLNYLWKSNDEFVAQNAGFMFSTSDTDSIIQIAKGFQLSRKEEIEMHSAKLRPDEKELLLYQNSARINSFLFYLGRMALKFPPDHSYFSFIQDIDNNIQWAKTLPDNVLWKYEIEYLNLNDSIHGIQSFLEYISDQTENKDLSDFLKAIYIKEIIEIPSYWQKHEKYLTPEALQTITKNENSNRYLDFISKSSKNFFSSQKGVSAYDFEAERIDGSKIKLSDFKGKSSLLIHGLVGVVHALLIGQKFWNWQINTPLILGWRL